jgi:hypothetical protein
MDFNGEGERDATLGFALFRGDRVLAERVSRPGAGHLAGHRVGFIFHRDPGGGNSDFAGFPCVRISRLRRQHRNVDDSQSFGPRLGMDERVFHQATGSKTWLNAANTWTIPLESQASTVRPADPTDIGFIIGTRVGNGYRLTGNPTYKSTLLDAGNTLAGLYKSKVGAVSSWTFGSFGPPNFTVIIDSMMTLGPLQWGATNGGMSKWATDATTHAETVTTNLVRGDGSTYEVAVFNQTTGALTSQQTFAGYSDSSTWARGEAWALYGFVQAYQTSDNPAFLATAEDIANYFVGQLVADGSWVPPWDFDAPGKQPVDTSAAAIAADGLVMLSTVLGSSGADYSPTPRTSSGRLAATTSRRPAGARPCCSMGSRATAGRIPR